MALKDTAWESVYKSGTHNLLQDFYTPALKHAVQYDRAVGYFSANILSSNLLGISSLVKNGGRMRLVIGEPLSEEEFAALKKGYAMTHFLDELYERLIQVLEESKQGKANNLELLSYLVANNKVEIKYAFRRTGMYHEKIGIIRDQYGDAVAFSGSANETVYALEDGYNAESIMVFPSWESSFVKYGQPCIDGFEELWNNQQKNTMVLDMPSQHYEEISRRISYTKESLERLEKISEDLYITYFSQQEEEQEMFLPRLPEQLGGKDFILGSHQSEAINKWVENDRIGILELATGSGKTITALAAATQLYQEASELILIVTVPYVDLAKQWVENLKQFNMNPLQCWGSQTRWLNEFKRKITNLRYGVSSFVSIVVVNKTLTGEAFQSCLSQLDQTKVMLIGDECHNLGAEKTNQALPDCHYRLGLSATPFRSDEDEIDSPFPDIAKERILSYFGSIVCQYTLEQAILDQVLAEYNYYIIPSYLTDEEQEKYDALSAEISQILVYQNGSTISVEQKNRLTILCGQRSMLLGGAENKYVALNNLLKQFNPEERKHAIFYCGVGRINNADLFESEERNIERVSRLLNNNGWKSSRFTSSESNKERNIIMEEFVSEAIDALVSIRVLDEGVDVPVCDKAFILASTKNPRQYIQRRGRVLRKAAGKGRASIYDFMVLPSKGSCLSKNRSLINSELERVNDFAKLAINKNEVIKKIDELGVWYV